MALFLLTCFLIGAGYWPVLKIVKEGPRDLRPAASSFHLTFSLLQLFVLFLLVISSMWRGEYSFWAGAAIYAGGLFVAMPFGMEVGYRMVLKTENYLFSMISGGVGVVGALTQIF